MNYSEIKEQQPTLKDCFFAFSNEQYKEAIEEHNLHGKTIYKGKHNIFGTQEGIHNFMNFYKNKSELISANCDPQEVYDYEYSNNECSYVCDDEEAIKIVIAYFGTEKAKTIIRKHAYYEF